jgi:hypothetical protein
MSLYRTARTVTTVAVALLVSVAATDRLSAQDVELEINVISGLGDLLGTNAMISGYDIASPSGSLTPAGWSSIAEREMNWLEITSTETLLSEGTLGTAFPLDGRVPLGEIFDEVNGSQDLEFSYLDENSVVQMGGVTYVPEPATLALLGAGAALALGHRGRRRSGHG